MPADERKTRHKVEEISGDAKERMGKVSGDKDLEREGSKEKSKADLKQAGEKVKDALP